MLTHDPAAIALPGSPDQEPELLLPQVDPTLDSPSPYHICIPVFISVLSISMCFVAVQQWFLLYVCSKPQASTLDLLLGNGPVAIVHWDECRVDRAVQTTAAYWSMVMGFCTSIPSLLTCPFWGALSDKLGRKPIMAVTPLGTITYICAILSVGYLNAGLIVLLVANRSYRTALVGMMAYLADTCEIRDRANVFVRGEAVILCAFAIGPFTGGLLTRVLPGGVYDVLWIALAGEVFSLLYYVCILPESHHSSRRAVKIANFWTTTQKTLKLIFLVPGKELLLLIAATAVISASFSGRSHFFLYAAYRLGWDSYDEGQFMLFSSLARTFYMIVVFPLIARAFAKARSTTTGRAKFEIWVARVCFAVYALSSVATGITTSVILLYMIAAIDSFGILASPTIRSLISSAVPAKMNAQLFSTVSLCEQLVGIVSSLLWPFIWTQSIDALPALFLFCCALLYIAGLCLMFFVHKAPEAIVMEDLESLVD